MKKLKLYDSVAEILSSWRLVTRQMGTFTFPAHMMLFDSSDGCYHAYLSQQRRSKSISTSQRNQVLEHLSKLSLALCKKTENWMFHKVSDTNPGRELALRVLKCRLDQTSCPEFLAASDEVVFPALSVLLSGLPSDITWDVCGVYDHNVATEGDLPATICWADGSEPAGVIWHKWYASVGKQHDEKSIVELLTLLPHNDAEFCLSKEHRDWMERKDEYDAYAKLYDLLRGLLFETNWQLMLYDVIDIGHSFFGIIFYDVLKSAATGRDLTIRTLNELMPEFAEAKHRDFAVYIEKMLLNEWDEAITSGFPTLGEPSDNRDCLLRLAKFVNRVVRTDLCCLRLTPPGGDGVIREGHFWKWKRSDKEYIWSHEISWPDSIAETLQGLEERSTWGEIVHVREEVAGIIVEMWLKPKGSFLHRDGGKEIMGARIQQLLRHRLQVIADYFSTILKRHEEVERMCSEFTQITQAAPKESRVQTFLEENPCLLSFDGKLFLGLLLSQLKLTLPSLLVSDFAFLIFDGFSFTLWLVEIEQPRPPLTGDKVKTDPSLANGCKQIRKWITLLEKDSRRTQYLKELKMLFLEAAKRKGPVDAVEEAMLEQGIRRIRFMLIAGDETYSSDIAAQPERKGERFGPVSDIFFTKWETYPGYVKLMRSALKVSWTAHSDTQCYNLKTGSFVKKRPAP